MRQPFNPLGDAESLLPLYLAPSRVGGHVGGVPEFQPSGLDDDALLNDEEAEADSPSALSELPIEQLVLDVEASRPASPPTLTLLPPYVPSSLPAPPLSTAAQALKRQERHPDCSCSDDKMFTPLNVLGGLILVGVVVSVLSNRS